MTLLVKRKVEQVRSVLLFFLICATAFVALLSFGCTIVVEGEGTARNDQQYGDSAYYDDQYCPYSETAPYSYNPDECHGSHYKDCCLWEVGQRYGRRCHEQWCYFYEDCTWQYETIKCVYE